jgi:hypothetical protein
MAVVGFPGLNRLKSKLHRGGGGGGNAPAADAPDAPDDGGGDDASEMADAIAVLRRVRARRSLGDTTVQIPPELLPADDVAALQKRAKNTETMLYLALAVAALLAFGGRR